MTKARVSVRCAEHARAVRKDSAAGVRHGVARGLACSARGIEGDGRCGLNGGRRVKPRGDSIGVGTGGDRADGGRTRGDDETADDGEDGENGRTEDDFFHGTTVTGKRRMSLTMLARHVSVIS